ncbi:nuclear transport factor 2 family protein [Patulibacter minatonensis]|uniref:nuclear transport factor 2 family protein n=1 Tax=Patulibacter minatonensis TaxID=298163 RepID=UPI00047E2369|nr:nuclear transport factor 2 family protein [Patulibacter minatonensis]
MSTTGTTRLEANKQTIRDFLEVLSTGDVAGAMEFVADDGTWWVAGTTPLSGTHTKAAFTALLGGVGDAFRIPLGITPKAFTAEGDRVAVEAEFYTERNDGVVYNNQYHFLFEVHDGKIRRAKEFLDTMHAADVLC